MLLQLFCATDVPDSFAVVCFGVHAPSHRLMNAYQPRFPYICMWATALEMAPVFVWPGKCKIEF